MKLYTDQDNYQQQTMAYPRMYTNSNFGYHQLQAVEHDIIRARSLDQECIMIRSVDQIPRNISKESIDNQVNHNSFEKPYIRLLEIFFLKNHI